MRRPKAAGASHAARGRRRLLSALVLLSLAASSGGCGLLSHLRDKLGFISAANAPRAKPKPSPTGAPAVFPEYLLQAFPDARSVRIDPQSPRLALAAETILTRDDPHSRRGRPVFSPDGRLVAWAEIENGERHLMIRKLDGTRLRDVPLRVASKRPSRPTDDIVTPVTWAPSSDAFAFTRATELGAFEVVVSDLAGEGARVEGPPAVEGMLAWAPSGDRIAYVPATHDDEIWTIDVTTRKATRLVRLPAAIESFRWAADGARIVLAAGWDKRDIYALDVAHASDPNALRKLTEWTFDDVSPSISPDGRWVAFYSSFRPLGAAPGWSLLVVAADGSDPSSGAALMDSVRAKTVSVHDFTPPPAWTPDSDWVAVIEPQSGEYHAIVLVNAEDGTEQELSPESVTNEDLTVSADGVLAWRSRSELGDHIVLGLTARGAIRVEH